MTLSLDTAYRSFGGEVEASSTPTICRLPDSRRHQLWAIARKKIMIVDRATGVVREAEIFVAVLGASNYTYAEATWTQKLADWIEAHVRMFRFFGGVPRLVVPDHLKSGRPRGSFYHPQIHLSHRM